MTTENGAKSINYENFGSALVAFAFKALRNSKPSDIIKYFSDIYEESVIDAIKVLFWTRDFRGESGCKGERQIFITCMKWLEENHSEVFYKLLEFVPKFGSWGDLRHFCDNTESKEVILNMYRDQLLKDIKGEMEVSLLAKWIPSENSSYDKKYEIYNKLAEKMGITRRQLRKTLVKLRRKIEVVESIIPRWSDINYEHVPSICMKNLRNAFLRNDQERFQDYLSQVASGEKKINTGVLFPYQMSSHYFRTNEIDETIEIMWKDYVSKLKEKTSLKNIITVSDVSGSMQGTPMEVCVSLSLLVNEINKGGIFENKVISFHENPSLFTVQGETLRDRVKNILDIPWGGSTNLQRAIDLLLTELKKSHCKEQYTLLILSDMQFNMADKNYKTNHQVMMEKFAKAEIPFPKIVYWNLRGDTVDFPVCSWDQNIVMVSGFSANTFKLFMDEGHVNPYSTVRKAIDNERYDILKF